MSRALRVLAVTLRYPPHVVGGYEQLTEDVVEGLRAGGDQVHVLCGASARLEGVEGVLPWLEPRIDTDRNLFELSHRGSNRERWALHFHSRPNARATARALRETGAEVLLYFNLGLASLAPLAAARRAGRPRVGIVCDLWPTNHWVREWAERGGKPLRQRALRFAARAWRRRVGLGRVLAPSAKIAGDLVADGIDPSTVATLPLGLTPEHERRGFAAEPAHRRPGEPLVVACTSAFWEGKGLHVLLAAAARAVERGADLRLLLVGDGEPAYTERLHELARAPALEGRVRFTGRVRPAELDPFLRSAHVFVFPSLWNEPFARAPMEAMAYGLAVVGSDAGGTPEQIVDRETGRLVPAGSVEALTEALLELEADEPGRAALAAAGRRHADRAFRFDRFLGGVRSALAAAVAGEGPR